MEHYRIIIDAMGGDHAPLEIVQGAIAACRESPSLHCILVGDEYQIGAILEKEKYDEERVEIVHTAEVIAMNEPPREAVEAKPDASINLAARLVRDGEGDGLVSAGSTGATILACSQVIPRMAAVERAVLAAIFPALKNRREDSGVAVMLDVGATLHCTVTQLVSFAIMGVHYAREVLSVSNPRVGLLNIGEEETKGHSTLVETHKALRGMSEFKFVGNVEGKDIMRGSVDVIVTEGITGNIVLKGLEGMAEIAIQTGERIWKKNLMSKLGIAMLAPVLKKLKKRMDYSEYGGAPILGFRKLVIKAHGRSKAKAIKNAVLLAEKSARNHLVEHIEKSMKQFYLGLFDHRQ